LLVIILLHIGMNDLHVKVDTNILPKLFRCTLFKDHIHHSLALQHDTLNLVASLMCKVVGLQSQLDLYPTHIIVGRHFWSPSSSFSHLLCTTILHFLFLQSFLCCFFISIILHNASFSSIFCRLWHDYFAQSLVYNNNLFKKPYHMRWSLFFHVIELVIIHDSLSYHRTMILLPNGLVTKHQKCITPIRMICYICL